MLSEREQRTLDEIEMRLVIEDPRFSARMTGKRSRVRLRVVFAYFGVLAVVTAICVSFVIGLPIVGLALIAACVAVIAGYAVACLAPPAPRPRSRVRLLVVAGSPCGALGWLRCMSDMTAPAQSPKRARIWVSARRADTRQRNSVAGSVRDPHRDWPIRGVAERNPRRAAVHRAGARADHPSGGGRGKPDSDDQADQAQPVCRATAHLPDHGDESGIAGAADRPSGVARTPIRGRPCCWRRGRSG